MQWTGSPSAASRQSCLVVLAVAMSVLFAEASNSVQNNGNETIYLLTVGPFPDPQGRQGFEPSWIGGPAMIAAARIARNHINERSDILPGYHLELLEENSGCSIVSEYAISLAKHTSTDKRKVAGIIGPVCSDSTKLLAPVIANEKITIIQISAATSPALVNVAYNTTLRTISSSLIYAKAFIALMRHNYWRRVAALYDGERTHFQISFSEFIAKVEEDDILSVEYESPLYEHFLPIEEIRRRQIRIIFAFVPSGTAAQLMCLAYHMGYTYPTYQWIFHDRPISSFVKTIEVTHNNKMYKCSKRTMEEAITGIILNNYILKSLDANEKSLPVNVSYKEYDAQYDKFYEEVLKERKLNESDVSASGPNWAGVYYDATWAMALALNNSIPEFAEKGLSLTDYTFGQKENTDIILRKLMEVDFKGVSAGKVNFQADSRDSFSVLKVSQVKCSTKNCSDLEEIQVGTFHVNLTVNDSKAFINDTFGNHLVTVHIAIGSLVLLLTAAILIVMVMMQLTNVVYYNFKPIKATSPNFSHLMFSGCYLLLLSVIFFVTKEVFDINPIAYGVMCNLFTLCICLGFTLVFGTVCAKIWRMYRIFHHFRSERAGGAISDNSLIIFVMLLLFLDLVLGVTWMLFDPWLRHSTSDFVGDEVRVTATCHCEYLLQWVLATVAYKGILVVVVLFLAILNRNIHRKEFQHTKKVSMFVYVEAMLAGIILPVYQIMVKIDPNGSFAAMVFFLLATVCCCVVCIFLPPIIPLIKIKYRGQPIRMYMQRFSTASLLSP